MSPEQLQKTYEKKPEEPDVDVFNCVPVAVYAGQNECGRTQGRKGQRAQRTQGR
jgi:hypothetical protein